jgi:hypothetical protein
VTASEQLTAAAILGIMPKAMLAYNAHAAAQMPYYRKTVEAGAIQILPHASVNKASLAMARHVPSAQFVRLLTVQQLACAILEAREIKFRAPAI